MRWPTVEIGRACLPTEQFDPSRIPDSYFRYVDIASINRSSKSITGAQRILGNEAPSRARKVIHAGDVLVSTVRPNLNTVAIVPEHLDGEIASTGFCVLRPNSNLLDGKYLFYKTVTTDFVSHLVARMKGANYPAVTDGTVKNALIPLPSLSEQRRIVEILDQADQLRKLRTDADKKAERILPALFNKMFGDPAINPMGWDTGVLGDVILDAAYGTSERACEMVTAGIPVLKMNNIEYWGRLNLRNLKYIENGNGQLDRYLLKKGDILFNRTNSSDLVGKTGLWNCELERAVPASYLIRLRVDAAKAIPEYIWAYMNTPFMKQNLLNKARRAIGMANINAQEVRSFPLMLPDIKEQERFSEKLVNIKALAPIREAASDKTQELFNLLLQRAFSGTLTASWREAHMKELLVEMEQQAKYLS